jgi:hypothetical protein
MLTCFLTFVRKCKTRCKTADAMYVLHEEVQWSDDDTGSDSDWPNIDPIYKKARKLSQRGRRKLGRSLTNSVFLCVLHLCNKT